VRVFDNGAPSLSTTQSFTVTVSEVNLSPSLALIADYSIRRNRLLTFTNAASDSDLPAQNLTFSLEGTAPSGVAIGPASGVFTWTPTASQAPTTNTLTVRVTDNGTPTLHADRSFTIVVTVPPSPAITLTDNGDDTVTLEWVPTVGETYQVQYQENLGSGPWTNLGSTITGNPPRLSVTDLLGNTQRFYRVLVVE
jgi:hypothetical protein